MPNAILLPEDEALFSRLARATVDSLWAILDDFSLPDQFVNQLTCIHPDLKMVGRAITMRYLPRREDLVQGALANAAWSLNKRVVDATRPGDVLVIDAGGETGGGCLGDLILSRFAVRGGAGLICDGAIRDLSIIKEMRVPLYLRGCHAAAYGRVLMAADADIPVRISGVTVVPGDIVVGDLQGFLVIPSHIAEEVANKALALDHEEEFQRRRILEDRDLKVSDAYPMNEKLRAEYEEYKKQHPPQL